MQYKIAFLYYSDILINHIKKKEKLVIGLKIFKELEALMLDWVNKLTNYNKP